MYRTGGRGHIAVIMVIATLAILVGGAIGVEAAIQRRILAPPQLDLRVGRVYIRASSSAPQPVPALPIALAQPERSKLVRRVFAAILRRLGADTDWRTRR